MQKDRSAEHDMTDAAMQDQVVEHKALGEGAGGRVMRVSHPSFGNVALKCIRVNACLC